MVQDYTSRQCVYVQAHMVWSSTTPTAPMGRSNQPDIKPGTRKTTLKQAQEKPSTRHGVTHDVRGCCPTKMVKYFYVGRGTVGVDSKLTITQYSKHITCSHQHCQGLCPVYNCMCYIFQTTDSPTSSVHNQAYKHWGNASICAVTMTMLSAKGFFISIMLSGHHCAGGHISAHHYTIM